MDGGALLILTGPPGAGKTTVGTLVAAGASPSACIHSDWLWTTIVNGHIPPWRPEADAQNRAVVAAAAAAAVRMANAGVTVVLDGIFGPWHFEPLTGELAHCAVPVHYAVLRPDGDTCLARARARVRESPRHRDALTEEGPIRQLWDRFSDLGPAERYVIDDSSGGPRTTAATVMRRMAAGDLVFPGLDVRSRTPGVEGHAVGGAAPLRE